MAAVIGRGIEGVADGDGCCHSASAADDYYDPNDDNNNNNNRSGGCLQSPFILYYTVTYSMNGIAIIGGIFSQFDLHRNNYYGGFDRCDAWLFANACFGVIHIAAAMYLVKKIREPEKVVQEDTTTYGDDGNGKVIVTGYRLHSAGSAPDNNNNNNNIIKSPHHRQQHSTSNNNANTGNVGSISISGLPDSTKRIKYVLCENYIFAIYIIFFIIYLCWHFFLEMNACNIGMAFAMRCADIFICAGPFSFAFSIGTLMHQHGRL
jgi:hypothetical protein